jgi:hypothetical protein
MRPFEIGLDEALDDGVALIEWPERLGEDVSWLIGDNRLTVTLSEVGAEEATIPKPPVVLRPFLPQDRGKRESMVFALTMSDRELQRLDFLKAAGLGTPRVRPCRATPRRGAMSG